MVGRKRFRKWFKKRHLHKESSSNNRNNNNSSVSYRSTSNGLSSWRREMHRLVRQIFTPRLQSQMASVHLAESLRPSWEEYAASLKPGKLKEFALEQGQNEIMTQLKVVSVRNWLRVLRDASLNIINLVSLHASEMMYSNPSIAEKVQTVISADLETQRDDQVRAMILLFVRPVLSRCPACNFPRFGFKRWLRLYCQICVDAWNLGGRRRVRTKYPLHL